MRTISSLQGTPFFPDAIKAYNIGSGWVEENYPFNALDYVLAVEGAFSMRGTVSRTLAANSKRFAAFPFIFDSGEDLVDDGNEIKGTASALWFPLWDRPTAYDELASFIGDAQARLPAKEARFSAEFIRALHSQGVDAGFPGWQEFRFKMKVSRVPWITTGSYVEAGFQEQATRLNKALAPLDESRFLDQFDIAWKGNKADSRSPHPFRAEINAAMENAIQEPSPPQCLALLGSIFRACRQMALSESFRDKLRGRRATFFRPLPMEEWSALLKPLDDQPEFRIARALASVAGLSKQLNDGYSEIQPMLGSLLPLKLGRTGWYLPGKGGDRSNQAVWSGADLCRDLAAVLQRRYLDSLKDDQPALSAVFGARLTDVLSFIRGELDDQQIARWTEELSLVGWRFTKGKGITDETVYPVQDAKSGTEQDAIPTAYAALRVLLELECEWQGHDRTRWKKRRSQQPVTLVCQRSTSSVAPAVSEALRWIAIWGVPNPWSATARAAKPRLAGRYVVSLKQSQLSFTHGQDQLLISRLAAAVCIPIQWEDRWNLYRTVTLPESV